MNNELIGAELDKAVAIALGAGGPIDPERPCTWPVRIYGDICQRAGSINPSNGQVTSWQTFSPSTNWGHIGPLIDDHKMNFISSNDRSIVSASYHNRTVCHTGIGHDHKTAACRAICS